LTADDDEAFLLFFKCSVRILLFFKWSAKVDISSTTFLLSMYSTDQAYPFPPVASDKPPETRRKRDMGREGDWRSFHPSVLTRA
jgi:hypothetical protein